MQEAKRSSSVDSCRNHRVGARNICSRKQHGQPMAAPSDGSCHCTCADRYSAGFSGVWSHGSHLISQSFSVFVCVPWHCVFGFCGIRLGLFDSCCSCIPCGVSAGRWLQAVEPCETFYSVRFPLFFFVYCLCWLSYLLRVRICY